MKIIMHGAAQEVGRSCIEVVSSKNTKILLDAGIKLGQHGSEFPAGLTSLSEIDGVFISHAHLDHSGALPLLDHNGLDCPVYATQGTKATSRMLWEDAFKIGHLKHEDLGYFEEDIDKATAIVKKMRFREKGKILDVGFQCFDAGHIPGSASILLNIDDKNVLYTGDIKTTETNLLKGANTNYGVDIDVLIIECTYGDREHSPRQQVEKRFLNAVRRTLDNGGSVLVPCFAVGRAQELLHILGKGNFRQPIFMDGMAVKATRIALNNATNLRDAKRLGALFRKAKIVKGRRNRRKLIGKKGIFLTTSGMLTGGPVMDYMKFMGSNPKNSLLLTGWQGPHTNGRLLEREGYVYIDGWKKEIKAHHENFDFSAHVGLADIKSLIKKLSPSTIILNHGDPEAIQNVKEWAEALDYNVYAPNLGDTISIE